MDTWIIIVALVVYIPAAVITDLPIIFDRQSILWTISCCL